MSVGVLIKEGQIGRKVLPVEKLKINNVGSGESYWVPEETTEVDSLDVSENGLYYAVNDDLDGYDQVNVNVSPDMTKEDAEKGKKVTGKGDDGNDYAYGLDEDENLTVEKVPSAIHIVVPPTKLKYEDGENIDFTGIKVYLIDGNNNLYTDEDYPTGEIPFEELLFPVTTADGSGQESGTWSGDGIVATIFTLTDAEIMSHATYSKHGLIGHPPFGIRDNGVTVYLGGSGDNLETTTVLVTRYGSNVYAARISGNLDSFNLYSDYEGSWPGDYALSASTAYKTTLGIFTLAQWEQWANVATSSVDPNGKSTENLHPDGIKIPVQWIRSDGEILEDSFEIEIVSEEQPVPAPQPDPWGGYADVSYSGHHYNLNRRIVPEVHYANGYLWQEGTSEYTVAQAIDMGWLILIR